MSDMESDDKEGPLFINRETGAKYYQIQQVDFVVLEKSLMSYYE